MPPPWHQLARRQRHNLATLRRAPLAEISGALGDLGTLLPLMAALALQGSVSLPATLVFSGLANVVSGACFGLPLPVQPMKAIAAAALASHASLPDTVAAGALVSAAVLLLAATGLLRRLAAALPPAVVKGIQLGAGLSLVLSAGRDALLGRLGWVDAPSWLDSRLWALAAFVGLFLTQPRGQRTSSPEDSRPRLFVPYALVVFAVGVGSALLVAAGLVHHVGNADHHLQLPHWAPWRRPRLVLPDWADGPPWQMAVAQLPLTTLNSVVAVSALADELFGAEADAATTARSVTAFGLSVGAMNLAGFWFGAMPVCHGAGGLAAQYRFGARSGASVQLLGLAKILLGLVFGDTLLDLLRAFPRSLLGVLVLASGLELAAAGAGASTAGGATTLSEDAQREHWTVVLTTAGCLLAFRNDAVGFLAGLLCYASYRLADRLAARRSRRHLLRRAGERQPLLS